MNTLKINYLKVLALNPVERISAIFTVIICFNLLLSPALASLNQETDETKEAKKGRISAISEGDENSVLNIEEAQASEIVEIKWSKRVVITAYNSEAGQTDNSPCITANNFNVCEYGVEDTIAANFLPFGAKVRIPELFGGRVFIVRDRMNRRFTNRVDVWMIERPDAVKFGVKVAKVEILK
jgi:3D (Asp-Asp-Asp) domain-containing protein